jgi:hypothetical protein
MEPIKLTLTDGKLTGDIALPTGAVDPEPNAHGARDLRPEEVLWRSDRVGPEARSLPANSLFPGGFTGSAGGGSF